MKITAQEGDTLDLICWRTFGKTAGVVEQALLENPSSGALGPVLPIGTIVVLPDIAPETSDKRVTVPLWD